MVVRVISFFVVALLLTGNLFAECTGELGIDANLVPGQWYDPDVGVKPCPLGRYCEGDGKARCCPAPYTHSTEGTQAEGDCYIPCSANSDNPEYTTENCGITKYNVEENPDPNGLDITCKDDNGHLDYTTYNLDYHYEGADGCYLNTRPCANFTTQDYDNEPLDKTKNRGDAVWNEGGGYNISACRHVPDEVDDQITHCTRRTFYKPYPHNVSTVSNTQGILHFYVGNVTDTSNYEKYFCVNCGSASYYPDEDEPTNIHYCEAPGSGFHKACQCHQIPRGNYSLTGTAWNNSQPIPDPAYAPCPAGKTTDAPGSTSSDDCHYTDQTQFCDAKGCFTLSTTELSAWGLTN